MRFQEVASFSVHHARRPWPWIAFDASGTRFAFAESESHVATRRLDEGALDEGALVEGPRFEVPAGLLFESFTLDRSGARLALTTSDALVTLGAEASGAEERRSSVADLGLPGWRIRAASFDRTGQRLWLSTENDAESALVLLDAITHAALGTLRSAPFPAPSLHELYTHPSDDAVLLLVAGGEDGSFARVAGWSDGPVLAIPTALDGGGLSAGFVGFSSDGAHVHLAEIDELRTHAWPGLDELSSVELADDFVSSYAGAVLGDRILVDGEDAETREDAVMQFDRTGLRGALLKPPFPTGMWAGRLGVDCVVTVDAKGDPAAARVLRLPLLLS